ncbi:hypothetical protein NBRC110019_19290 [Neptunitalea chrysea]|uniref:Polysaccharide biosynthesis protein CapD-like domain-containing protein n=1 Tax=Neptunitalea chrysea TaxID=1647581 RepID=A0A9W6B7W2_9FLAO|nr:polysaccharide biosynthesis protein [Neptunitalea chrysea]GLB52889.1 hypothetical protein NBRC110019_19290 [Neptunitalea chrysea]
MTESDFIPEIDYNIDVDAIYKILSGKTVLITGAGGSIGSNLVKKVLKYTPSKLILIDIAETPLHAISRYVTETGATNLRYLTDIRNKNRLQSIFNETTPDIVFHVAAYKHVWLTEENPAEAIEVNLLGTKNVCEVAVSSNCEKVVFISTDKAVNPISVLGITKQLAEQYVLYQQGIITNTKFSIVRFGNVFNSNGSVIETFKSQLLAGKPVTLTSKEVERYFLTINAACDLILQCTVLNDAHVLYTFDMGASIKIESILNKLIDLLGITPVEIIETGLQPGEKLYEELYEKTALIKPTTHTKIIALYENRNTSNIVAICNHLEEIIAHIHSPQKIKLALIEALTNCSIL